MEIKQNCMESNQYIITKKEINELNNISIVEDKQIKRQEYFKINCFEFCPKIFKYLREIDKVSEDELISSFLPQNNEKSVSKSAGRSGQLFIHSHDKKFILKTIEYEELEFIRSIFIEKFADYITKTPESLISRIYGVYKIKMRVDLCNERELYFMLMKNVFGIFKELHCIKYDLKGSVADRKVDYDIENPESQVYKDINFKEMERVLLLSSDDSVRVRNILQTDASFLFGLEIMDYSLLVVKIKMNKSEIISLYGPDHFYNIEREIQKVKGESEPEKNEQLYFSTNIKDDVRFKLEDVDNIKKYLFPSLSPTNVYVLAIIDFFQLYNFKKRGETCLKSFRSKKIDISSQPPKLYYDRFIINLEIITNSKKFFTANQEDYIVIDETKSEGKINNSNFISNA